MIVCYIEETSAQYSNVHLYDQPNRADPLNLFQFWQNKTFPFNRMEGFIVANKWQQIEWALLQFLQEGEVDCWPLLCPNLNCEYTAIAEGECCPHCVSDPCLADSITYDIRKTCLDGYGITRLSGAVWTMVGSPCTTCKCKVRWARQNGNGNVCSCRKSGSRSALGELTVRSRGGKWEPRVEAYRKLMPFVFCRVETKQFCACWKRWAQICNILAPLPDILLESPSGILSMNLG